MSQTDLEDVINEKIEEQPKKEEILNSQKETGIIAESSKERRPDGKKEGKKRGPKPKIVDAENIQPLTSDINEVRTATEKLRKNELLTENENLKKELGNYRQQEATTKELVNSCRFVLGRLVKQVSALMHYFFPPKLSDEEEVGLTEAWVPVLVEHNMNIKPVYLALIITAGILLPRIISKGYLAKEKKRSIWDIIR